MSDNPYSPSNAPVFEYPTEIDSNPWHLRAAIWILAIHATISFVLLIIANISAASRQQQMISYSVVNFIMTGMLALAAYLLYRRNKHAYLPVSLYLLRAIFAAISTWVLFRTYAEQHPDTTQDFSFGGNSPLPYIMLASEMLPILKGLVYTGYCLYLRKKRLLT